VKDFNYDKDLTIDIHKLHEEWNQQSHLFMRYAEEAADAKLTMDRLKERVDVVKAELDTEIRKNPDRYGIVKLTEGQVQSHIVMDVKYREAMAEYLESRHQYDLLSAAVRAMDQKRSALENLVRLHGQQYFSVPQVTTDDWAEERRDRTRSSVRRRMNERDE